MGEALISRLIQDQIISAASVIVSDPQAERRQWLSDQYGLNTTADNAVVIQAADIILLAIKPQVLPAVAKALPIQQLSHQPLLLSILAGITLERLQIYFPGWPIIRAMPNTPATVGAGITALAPSPQITPEQLIQAHRIFSSVGVVLDVPESLMDAVTALSGSGPGYVAIIIEALSDGGVAAGLPRKTATQLVLQTLKGTVELLEHTQWHPADLKDRVTSPGGTTIAGIASLEASGLRSALIQAVQAAAQRSRELGA